VQMRPHMTLRSLSVMDTFFVLSVASMLILRMMVEVVVGQSASFQESHLHLLKTHLVGCVNGHPIPTIEKATLLPCLC
jgi:hypothetical protein